MTQNLRSYNWDFCMAIIKSDWSSFYTQIQEYIKKQLNNI